MKVVKWGTRGGGGGGGEVVSHLEKKESFSGERVAAAGSYVDWRGNVIITSSN